MTSHRTEAENAHTTTEQLRKNIDDVTAGLGDQFANIRGEAEDLFEEAVKKGQQGAKVLKSQIKQHPYRSLAIALVVGFIAGAILTSDHDN